MRSAVDPLVAIGTLAAAVALFGGSFDGACLILALLVFAMTFPGSLARDRQRKGGRAGARHRRRLARDRRAAAVRRLGLADAGGLRPARAARLGARDARGAVRGAPPDAVAAAAPAGRRGAAQDRGDRRRERHRPAPRRGDPRRPAARHALRRLLRRPRRGPPAEPAGRRQPRPARAPRRLRARPPRRRRSTSRCRWPRSRASSSCSEDLRDTTASIYFVPDIFVSDLIQARVDSIGGMPVVAVCETPFYGFNGLVKRVSDFVLAALILRADLAADAGHRRRGEAVLARAGAVQAAPLRPRRQEDHGLQVPLDDGGRGRRRGAPGHAQRQRASRRSAPSCAAPRSTSCRSSSTCCRGA